MVKGDKCLNTGKIRFWSVCLLSVVSYKYTYVGLYSFQHTCVLGNQACERDSDVEYVWYTRNACDVTSMG